MRVAVSGSHGTGKSTLIAAFLDRRPGFVCEPEAYETLADDVSLTEGEGPAPEGLEALLDYTLAAVGRHPAGSRVVFERSPVDYLAYAAASRGWEAGARAAFIRKYTPLVRGSLRGLDLIAFVPVSRGGPIRPRPGEDARFRRRVDERLRRALLDDHHGLFGGGRPRVAELPPDPARHLAELLRLTD